MSDDRPEKTSRRKIKKTGSARTLRLTPNPDILAEMGRKKKGQILVGFALEVQDPVKNALVKARRKNLDYIVLNSPRAVAAGRTTATVFRAGQREKAFRSVRKETLAVWLIRELERARRRKA